jgi:hypothetical protein
MTHSLRAFVSHASEDKDRYSLLDKRCKIWAAMGCGGGNKTSLKAN